MTRITISLILAIIFIVATFSKPLIPCSTENKSFDFCKLEGQQNYFYTDKLSNVWVGGGIAFILSFLIIYSLTFLLVRKKQTISM